MTTVIVALISTLGVVATTLIQSIQANKKDNIETKLTSIQLALKEEKLDRCKRVSRTYTRTSGKYIAYFS